LLTEGGDLRREDLVFRDAEISTNPVFINGIHDYLVSELIAADQELYRFIGCPIFFL